MKILGFTGFKRSGKDTAAECIIQSIGNWNIYRVAFADALKQEAADVCGVSVEFIEQNKEAFRPMLQWWGTDFRRKFHGDDYWLRKWMQRVLELKDAHMIIVPDVRFQNEADLLRQFDGKIFRIVRFGLEPDQHESETNTVNINVEEEIINNDSKEHLQQTVLNKFFRHYGTKHIHTLPLSNAS